MGTQKKKRPQNQKIMMVDGLRLGELQTFRQRSHDGDVVIPPQTMLGILGIRIFDGDLSEKRCWIPTLKTAEEAVRCYPLGSRQRLLWDDINGQLVFDDYEDAQACSVVRRRGAATIAEVLEAQGVDPDSLKQCGAPTQSGAPCRNPTTENGRCSRHQDD